MVWKCVAPPGKAFFSSGHIDVSFERKKTGNKVRKTTTPFYPSWNLAPNGNVSAALATNCESGSWKSLTVPAAPRCVSGAFGHKHLSLN